MWINIHHQHANQHTLLNIINIRINTRQTFKINVFFVAVEIDNIILWLSVITARQVQTESACAASCALSVTIWALLMIQHRHICANLQLCILHQGSLQIRIRLLTNEIITTTKQHTEGVGANGSTSKPEARGWNISTKCGKKERNEQKSALRMQTGWIRP